MAKGGENMFKKLAIGTGVFAVSAISIVSMAFAQTSTPAATTTTITPTPTTSIPSGAPATGRGN